MKARIIISFLISIVVFIVAFAVLCPAVDVSRIEPVGEPLFEAYFDNEKFNCKEINVLTTQDENFDYIIICDLSEKQIKSINITFENSATEFTQTQIECANNADFIKGTVFAAKRYTDDTQSCVSASADFLRICSSEEIKGISFYSSEPQETVKPLEIKANRCLMAVLFAVLSFLISFFVDKRFKICLKFLEKIKNSKRRILIFIVGITTALSVSVCGEVILRCFIGPDSMGRKFNTVSFALISTVLILIFLFWFERKNIQLKPERLVAGIILLLGTLIIFTEPFSHNSSDEDSHYFYAVQNSFYKEAYLTTADINVRNTAGFATAHSQEESSQNIITMNKDGLVVNYATAATSSIPHKPAGAIIAVARLCGASFWERFVAGQFAMLFIYATTVYFAIKRLKSGKMMMSVIALFPTNIVLACNYSYDPWVTGFSLLGTAYFVSEVQQPQKRITVWETVVMCGAFVVASLPKQIYCLLLLIPAFMIKKWSTKHERRNYYVLLLAFFAFIFTLFIIRSLSTVSGAGDLRGGAVNPSEQIAYIFENPIEYAIKLLKFVVGYISPLNANKSINFFSYLGNSGSPVVFLLLLSFCAITDKSEEDRFYGANFIKIVILVLEFTIICMIATALYIDFTPVAGETINGCHPRYLMPLIAPLSLFIMPPWFAIKQKRQWYNTLVLLTMTATLLFKISNIVVLPMI